MARVNLETELEAKLILEKMKILLMGIQLTAEKDKKTLLENGKHSHVLN